MWKSTLFIKRGVALFTTIAQYEGRKPSKEMDEEIPHLSSHLLSDTQTKGCTVHTAQLREIYAWAPAHSFASMTRSYKTDDKPLLNLAGALSRCSREGDYVYTKEGTRSPPLSTVTTGGLVCIR